MIIANYHMIRENGKMCLRTTLNIQVTDFTFVICDNTTFSMLVAKNFILPILKKRYDIKIVLLQVKFIFSSSSKCLSLSF